MTEDLFPCLRSGFFL